MLKVVLHREPRWNRQLKGVDDPKDLVLLRLMQSFQGCVGAEACSSLTLRSSEKKSTREFGRRSPTMRVARILSLSLGRVFRSSHFLKHSPFSVRVSPLSWSTKIQSMRLRPGNSTMNFWAPATVYLAPRRISYAGRKIVNPVGGTVRCSPFDSKNTYILKYCMCRTCRLRSLVQTLAWQQHRVQ